jgi:hypothetical protein
LVALVSTALAILSDVGTSDTGMSSFALGGTCHLPDEIPMDNWVAMEGVDSDNNHHDDGEDIDEGSEDEDMDDWEEDNENIEDEDDDDDRSRISSEEIKDVIVKNFMRTFSNGNYDTGFDNALCADRGHDQDVRPMQALYNKPDNWRERGIELDLRE